MDFQIREPLHPLLGGLRHTNVMMETQAAQEYVSESSSSYHLEIDSMHSHSYVRSRFVCSGVRARSTRN